MSPEEERHYSSKTYSNGDKYFGEMEDGLRHGFGMLLYQNGSIFRGKFQNNSKEGLGKLEASNGDEYIGRCRAKLRLLPKRQEKWAGTTDLQGRPKGVQGLLESEPAARKRGRHRPGDEGRVPRVLQRRQEGGLRASDRKGASGNCRTGRASSSHSTETN